MLLFKEKFIAYLKKKKLRMSIGALLTILFTLSSAGYFDIPGIDLVEHQIYDLKVILTTNTEAAKASNVVILDVDEKSLGALGRWPWSRSLLAKINDKLFDQYKISALGYDVVWAEYDNANPKSLLEKLNLSSFEKSPHYEAFVAHLYQLDSDRLFAESLYDRAVVLGYYFNNDTDAVLANVLPAPALTEQELPTITNSIIASKGYTGNLPELTQAAMSGGHFNPIVDVDGVIRKIPLLVKYRDNYYQSLSLGLVRAALGSMPITPEIKGDKETNYFTLEALNIGPLSIPVASDGTAFVPYYGKDHTFPYISVLDLLNDKISAAELEGKIVLMGSSAPGLRDQRTTPLQNVFSGVEIHANMIAGILANEIKLTPAYSKALALLQVLFAGLFFLIFLPALGPITASFFAMSMLAIGAVSNYLLWTKLNFVLPIAQPMMLVILIFLIDTSIGYFTVGKSKRNMAALFGQYVPPELVEKMAEDPLRYNMNGKDADLTVLFTDIRGFTGISEQLTATQLTAYINEYFTSMSTIINQEQGTLDKYIGDAIMAFWGAPVENNRHAYFAIITALKISEEADRLANSFKDRGLPPFNIGIGLNSGLMRVGDMGSFYRRSYTVMGDPVNLASRLEGLTQIYGLRILVGEAVKNSTPEFAYQEIDRVKVKGKNIIATIYTPVGLHQALSTAKAKEIELWSKALPLYYEGQWDAFIQALNHLLKSFGDNTLYALYLKRAQSFKNAPPHSNWSGVSVFNEK